MGIKSNIIKVVSLTVLSSFAFASEVSLDLLKERAAFALGVDKSKVQISDVKKDNYRIDFIVTAKGKTIPCYVTSAAGVTSDALCSGKSNALLDAAGRK